MSLAAVERTTIAVYRRIQSTCSQPNPMRRASASEFWSFAQRYLSFEEPSDRCNRLKQLLYKLTGMSPKAVADIPMAESAGLLGEIFGAQRPPTSLLLLNVILALQDVRMFQTQAFDSWLIENRAQSVVP